jgi:DNA repair protein RadC
MYHLEVLTLQLFILEIIICHNHPSGDPSPSNEDINITHRLKESGKLLGIDLIDHIIIGNGSYISLKEKGIL